MLLRIPRHYNSQSSEQNYLIYAATSYVQKFMRFVSRFGSGLTKASGLVFPCQGIGVTINFILT
jgi:hypothetical protein